MALAVAAYTGGYLLARVAGARLGGPLIGALILLQLAGSLAASGAWVWLWVRDGRLRRRG